MPLIGRRVVNSDFIPSIVSDPPARCTATTVQVIGVALVIDCGVWASSHVVVRSSHCETPLVRGKSTRVEPTRLTTTPQMQGRCTGRAMQVGGPFLLHRPAPMRSSLNPGSFPRERLFRRAVPYK